MSAGLTAGYNGVMNAGLTTGNRNWGGGGGGGRINYMDSLDFRPSVESYPQSSRPGVNTGFCTDDFNYGGQEQENRPPIDSEKPTVPKEGRFSCSELSAGSTGEGTLVESFGTANSYLQQLTLKLFNPKVVPDRILYGIVYFDVKETMRINRLRIKGNGKITKQIKKKESTQTEFPTTSFTKDVVTIGGSTGTRSPNSYTAETQDFDGSDVYQRLNLPANLSEGDQRLKPFSGPITLSPGTHAIPFAVRIPGKTNPTITFNRKSKKFGTAEVQLLYTIVAEVEMQASPSGNNATVSSEKVAAQIVSCAGLPPLADSRYYPAAVQVISLPYKSSEAILIVEKTHLQSPDTIRLYVYSNSSKAIHSAYFELFQLTNLPELGMSADGDVANFKNEPGLELIGTSKKASMKKDFRKQFSSKVGEKFPPNDETSSRSTVNPNLDDRTKMPESSRKAGCVMELSVPADLNPNIEVGDTKIKYQLRVHMDVKGSRKSEKLDQPITISEELLPNYKMQYINFVD
ncbi:hypothetical protein AAHC03_05493 [Spirometra sp. Aus1]